MPTTDHHGNELTGASSKAADLYVQAIQTYHGYWGQPFPLLNQALADSPGFVMAHALKGYMTLMGSNVPVRQIGLTAHTAALTLAATPREAAHVAAVGMIAAGEFRAAGHILEDISLDHPTDVLALQAGQSPQWSSSVRFSFLASALSNSYSPARACFRASSNCPRIILRATNWPSGVTEPKRWSSK